MSSTNSMTTLYLTKTAKQSKRLKKRTHRRKFVKLVSQLIKPVLYDHCGDWAYENRILPPENAEPGKFKIGRTPYFIAPAKALAMGRFLIVAIQCATQMSKTELCFNFLGHSMDVRAQPAMFVFPTQKLAEKVSQTRFKKLLKSCESLSRKHEGGKSDKITLKIIGGAPLIFAYATSANQLCSDAIAKACIDEYDRCPDNVEGEGSPLELVLARMVTFPNAKLLLTSTPTLLGISPINNLIKEGIYVFWHVKCPSCKGWTLPNFESFGFDDEDYEKVSRAWFECNHCQFKIDDTYKSYVNTEGNGEYFHICKETGDLIHWEEIKNNNNASFWVSGLVSPWRKLLYCAELWLRALASGSESRKQAVMNTIFGEAYEGMGEKIDFEEVKNCRISYKRGELYAKCSDLIFMTMDVQKDGIYYVIRGWSTSGKSALVDYGFVFGDPKDVVIWNKMFAISQKKWGKYPVNFVFTDCGYLPEYVYAFCKKNGSNRFLPVRGRDKQSTPILVKKLEHTIAGKIFQYGLKVFSIEEGHFKDILYNKIRDCKSWFVPSDVCDDYCKQVTAESKISDGIREKWQRHYKHNHYLDCEKMQVFASILCRIDLLTEESIQENEPEELILQEKERIDTLLNDNDEEMQNLQEDTDALKILKSKKNLGTNVWS